MNIDGIKSIFYRQDFFREQKFDGGKALRFYTLTITVFTIASVLFMIPDAIKLLQSLQTDEWTRQENIVKSLYPENFEITYRNGEVTTNSTEPVTISVPSEWRTVATEFPAHLLVIDTTKPITSADFESLDTLAILSKTEAGFHDLDTGEIRIMNLRDQSPDGFMTINAEIYDKVATKFFKVARTVIIAGIFLLPLLMFFVVWMMYLVYSLFGALFVWLAARFRGQRLSYGRAYLTTLFLLPTPLAIQFFLLHVLRSSSHIPFLFTLILFIAAFLNFSRSTPVSQTTQEVGVPENQVGTADQKNEENRENA